MISNEDILFFYAAEAEMQVTCGPTIVSTTIPTTPTTTTTIPTVTTTASFPFEVDAQGSEMHPGGTIMTKEVSLPADDSVLDKNGNYCGQIPRTSQVHEIEPGSLFPNNQTSYRNIWRQ